MGEEGVGPVKEICGLVVYLAVGAEERGMDLLLWAWTTASCVGSCDEELVVDFQADLDWKIEEACFMRFLLLLLNCGSHDDLIVGFQVGS